jgi:3',5'-cyclic AMP phosphodiesterase CpdA
MFTLAHLSDPHLPPLPEPRLRDLMGKRITGYLNWRFRRGPHHQEKVLDAILEDLAAARPDHIAVTGDLANLALDPEFARGRDFLARLGPPDRVTVVPGNHDAYVHSGERAFLREWAEYLAGDKEAPHSFPFLRERGPVSLIGLSTAVPTPILFATGRLGRQQLDRLEASLAELGARDRYRVVLIHHPPAGERPWLRRLEDAESFRGIIAQHGAELILSGHDHRAARHSIPGPKGAVPVIQVPSASAPLDDKHGAAAFNLYRIGGKPGEWTTEVETRGLTENGKVATLSNGKLSAAR